MNQNTPTNTLELTKEEMLRLASLVGTDSQFATSNFINALDQYVLEAVNKAESKYIEVTLDDLIEVAGRSLRSVSWHSDGRVMAKSGAGARHPRKIYSAKTPHEAVKKLISENIGEELETPNQVEGKK